MREAHVATAGGKFKQDVTVGPHHLTADEPVAAGGTDEGPAPHDFILVALGACTSMTVKMYADRKGWPLERVDVRLTMTGEGSAHTIHRVVKLEGALSDEQRTRLLEIAGKCPVHKTLTGTIAIESELG